MAKRKELVAEMHALLSKATDEARSFSEAEQKRYDTLKTAVDQMDELTDIALPAGPTNPTRPVGAPALHLGQHAPTRAGLLRGALALAAGERGIDTGLASEFDTEVRRRNPSKTFPGVAMSLKSLLVEKASDIGALPGSPTGLASATTGTQYLDSLFFRTGDAIFGPRLADALGVNTIVATEETVHVTKLTGTVTPTWISRDGDVPQSDAVFDADLIEPKSVGTQITLKRSALLYGHHPQVEPLMVQELRNAVLAALDDAVLFGPGGLAPLGVASQATAGHALNTLADGYIIRNELISYLKSADPAGAKWLLDDLTEGKFSTQAAFSGATAPAILGGVLAGFPYILRPVSGAGSPTPAGSYLFGAWSYLHLILFDSVSVVANPFGAQFASGGIDVRVLADANSYLRDPARILTGSAAVLAL